MYFKNMDIQKGYTEFEKKETLTQMPGSTLANKAPVSEDGNNFFKEI